MKTMRHRRFAEMLANGKSLRECAVALHMSKPALRGLAAQLGLKLIGDDDPVPERNPRDEYGAEPLPPFHPIAVSFLPKLASLGAD